MARLKYDFVFSFEFREHGGPYSSHFEVQKDDIGHINPLLGNNNYDILGR